MRLKVLAGNLALMLVAVGLSLAVAEIGLRIFLKDVSAEPVTSNQYEFYQFDPVLGWSNSPGARGTFSRAEFSYELRINSHGLRGPETDLQKPAGRQRIAVLGDSFTWGIGAAETDLYLTLMQQEIPGSEVLNFGVSGYGPVQFSLMTERVLQFSPDVVVIAFCLGNDFFDNVFWRRYSYYKPYARLDRAGDLVIDGYPLPNIRLFNRTVTLGTAGWLTENLRLARLVEGEVLSGIARWWLGQKGPALGERAFYERPDSAAARETIAVNRKLMQRIAEAYRAQGVPVVVLAVPSRCEFGRCHPGAPQDTARNALAASVDGLPVTLIDPTPDFSLADFWVRDGHWRPVGHRKAADALVPVVRKALADRRAAIGAGAGGI